MLPIITTLLPLIGNVLDRIIPNVAEREKVKMELQLKLAEQEGELLKALIQSDLAQADINKVEAASDNPVKSLWRPVLAWVLVGITAIQLSFPFVVWALKLFGFEPPPPPPLSSEEVMFLLPGLLGLTAARSHDKKHKIN